MDTINFIGSPPMDEEDSRTLALARIADLGLRRPARTSGQVRPSFTPAAAAPPRAPQPARVVLPADPAEDLRREARERDFKELQADLKGIRTNRVRARRQMVNFVRCGGGVLWSGLPEEAIKSADPQVTRQAAALVASLRL
jgi:hypothetical protein